MLAVTVLLFAIGAAETAVGLSLLIITSCNKKNAFLRAKDYKELSYVLLLYPLIINFLLTVSAYSAF